MFEERKSLCGKFVMHISPETTVTIYRTDDNTVVHSYKQSTEVPYLIKSFAVINGVTWFIGMLNYAVKHFVNCETGDNYTSPENFYETWHSIREFSPSGKHAIVSTYVCGGNDDANKIYDMSKLATHGPVETYLLNVPSVFNERMCEMEFVDDDHVKLFYYNEYDNNKRCDIGIFKIKQ